MTDRLADRPIIFTYQDYRKFLHDFIESRRSQDRKYSLIYFSKQIKVSDSYLKHVVSKKRHLNMDAAVLLAKKLLLDSSETSYFLTLILKESSESTALKNYFESLMVDQRKQTLAYTPNKKLNSIFSNSLMWEIFSLIGVEGFSEDPRWIASHLTRRKVPTTAIEQCIHRLQVIGAIKRENGKIIATDVVAKHTMDLDAVYRMALERAIEHLNYQKGDAKSYFDSFCLILSDDEYNQIREILESTKRKIASVARKKGPKSRIAFYNANLFFASK